MKTISHFILSILFILSAFVARGQIQQAWVARYNNGINNGTNQAVKMALDSAGNIYVTGCSQNTNSQLGYVTIKYAPNGNQLWASRFDSTNFPAANPAALVLDNSNNVIVTGSALTIKYDSNGNQLWTAPYAGTAMADDSSGNVYVTGFGTNFTTVKLASAGTNLWLTTYRDVGPTLAQAIVIDVDGNAYVCGSDTCQYYEYGNFQFQPVVELLTIKYGPDGSRLWIAQRQNLMPTAVQLGGIALDMSGSFYCTANWTPGNLNGYAIYKFDSGGALLWSAVPNLDAYSRSTGLTLQGGTNVLITGKAGNDFPNFLYGTYGCNTNGSVLYTNYYPQPAVGVSVATSIAVDSANNSYVTGYSPGTNSLNDIVTIKYSPSGNQLWLQRYNGPGNGNDAGNAIAVDNNGNVYVAGYDTTTAGGTEMVLIKYSPFTVQKQADGSMLLQAQGSPGENFDIQASADLINWLDLGIVTADTNGLMQFDDTNAPNYPARFYYTNPQ